MISLLFLIAAPVQDASDWYTLLQTRHSWECSADYIISGGLATVLTEGLPMTAFGSLPSELPWPDASVTDPLESGIWGGGRWCTNIADAEMQDSSSLSRIGLIQNTMDHSRYSFELSRPLPAGISGNFGMMRDDSVSLQSALLKRGSLSLRSSSWQGNDYGWGAWTGWSSSLYYARAGFARLSPGDRRPELLGGIRGAVGPLDAELGAAVAYADSAAEYRGAGEVVLPAGDFKFIAAGDLTGSRAGCWGGISWNPGDVIFSAVYSNPSGADAFQAVSIRHESFTLTGRFMEDPAVAADISASTGILRGKAAGGWFFDSDSLELNCHVLLGYDWYRGRLEAGPRLCFGVDSAGDRETTLDGVIGFTLLPFSIAAGMEDITDSYERSWSFGITWAFTDRPPESPEGDESGRGRG